MCLKNHPFAVEAFFENSLVLTYAVPKEHLEKLIPPCLKLDTFLDKWAFVAVALVQTKHLRPKGFPTWLGNDFCLVGYRVFVQYTTSEGKRLRGLYILKSETDKLKMQLLGNIFTHYKYSKTDILLEEKQNHIYVKSEKSQIEIEAQLADDIKLPTNSPFEEWKQARRFAGPLPFTFTFNEAKNEVLIIEGVRENWIPQPIEIVKAKVGFIEQLHLPNVVLANAFLLKNIPYFWKKGKVDQWKN